MGTIEKRIEMLEAMKTRQIKPLILYLQGLTVDEKAELAEEERIARANNPWPLFMLVRPAPEGGEPCEQ
ncbi:hypothetical protein DS62_10900 [Smithella sp. SC_K08D17]|jgi:hypothetical protein|nr:hypothetical protein KD27_05275 [Smithella sp. D17]KIE18418.1 hypothetical protein DS62_10900 [Smithella sp. SC_K08D17]